MLNMVKVIIGLSIGIRIFSKNSRRVKNNFCMMFLSVRVSFCVRFWSVLFIENGIGWCCFFRCFFIFLDRKFMKGEEIVRIRCLKISSLIVRIKMLLKICMMVFNVFFF